jgi:hypothetical protein
MGGTVKVYLVEHGDYEQRGVWGVYVSESAAVAGVKATFAPPYIVKWDEPKRGRDRLRLTGHFEAVQHYSTQHVGDFDISEWELMGEAE